MELILACVAGLAVANLVSTVFALLALAETRATVQKLYGFAESVRRRPRG
jgi:hypothetical protein